MKKIKSIIFLTLFIFLLLIGLVALKINVDFSCSAKDLFLYRLGGFLMLVSYAIGFLIEYIICKFTHGIKSSPVKKRVILWIIIVSFSFIAFVSCYSLTSSEFKTYSSKSNSTAPIFKEEITSENDMPIINNETKEDNIVESENNNSSDIAPSADKSESNFTIEEPQQSEESSEVKSDKKKNVIIGSTAEEVRTLLRDYTEKKSNFDNALDFENKYLLITVFMKYSAELKTDVADGVYFMSCNYWETDPITLEGAYVSRHYDELVALSTDDPNILIESDFTKYNSMGVKKAAAELYIGNVPE